jgi:ABC-type transporter Mla maintaining outer membrane lipid asymmetry permease subunit MlaE
MLTAPSFLTAALALGLLLTYTAVIGILFFALFALRELVFDLAMWGRRKDEFVAFSEAWISLKKHYRFELCVALIAPVLFDVFIRRG